MFDDIGFKHAASIRERLLSYSTSNKRAQVPRPVLKRRLFILYEEIRTRLPQLTRAVGDDCEEIKNSIALCHTKKYELNQNSSLETYTCNCKAVTRASYHALVDFLESSVFFFMLVWGFFFLSEAFFPHSEDLFFLIEPSIRWSITVRQHVIALYDNMSPKWHWRCACAPDRTLGPSKSL